MRNLKVGVKEHVGMRLFLQKKKKKRRLSIRILMILMIDEIKKF